MLTGAYVDPTTEQDGHDEPEQGSAEEGVVVHGAVDSHQRIHRRDDPGNQRSFWTEQRASRRCRRDDQ